MRLLASWIRAARFGSFFCFSSALFMVIFFDSPNFAYSDEQLQAIIENLRENEKLYENVEIRWREIYRKKYYPEIEKADVPKSSDIEGRWVRQNEMFYLNFEGQLTGPPADPKQTGVHNQKGYDGELTRFLQLRHNYIGNIIKGPAHDYRGFDPHTIPLRWARTAVPLSTFLGGRDAILAHPRGVQGDVVQNLFPTSSYAGEENLNGLRCHKITLDHVRNKGTSKERTSARRDFWLAIDRNYLPVKVESYNYFYSKEIPIEEAVLENLQEIQPGIWFPFLSSITVMDGITLREEKKTVVSWKRDYIVTEASLNPEYDVNFFRKVEFPNGTPIYEIEDGKIVRSYVKGGIPLADQATENTHSRFYWIIAINLVMLVVIAFGFWFRQRRLADEKTSTSSPSTRN